MSNSIEETLDDELDDDHPLSLVNSQIEGLLEGDGASEDHEDVIAFLLATGLPRSTVDRVHKAIVWGDSKVQPPKQRHPWPNHNFCVGCTGETCMGCGTEPQERRKTPAAVEQTVVSGTQAPAKLQFPTVLRKMWSGGEVQDWLDAQRPLYTRSVPTREMTDEDIANIHKSVAHGPSLAPSRMLTFARAIERFLTEEGE